MLDVDFGDMIDFLGDDGATRSILIYMEGVGNARKFMSAAQAFARRKPIIILKPGRFAEGARAAHSHTGAMAGDDEVYEAAFKRAGVVRVGEIAELFDAAQVLDSKRLPAGPRLAMVTSAGGPGVMATDALIHLGGKLAELSEESMKQLNAFLPPYWSKANHFRALHGGIGTDQKMPIGPRGVVGHKPAPHDPAQPAVQEADFGFGFVELENLFGAAGKEGFLHRATKSFDVFQGEFLPTLSGSAPFLPRRIVRRQEQGDIFAGLADDRHTFANQVKHQGAFHIPGIKQQNKEEAIRQPSHENGHQEPCCGQFGGVPFLADKSEQEGKCGYPALVTADDRQRNPKLLSPPEFGARLGRCA